MNESPKTLDGSLEPLVVPSVCSLPCAFCLPFSVWCLCFGVLSSIQCVLLSHTPHGASWGQQPQVGLVVIMSVVLHAYPGYRLQKKENSELMCTSSGIAPGGKKAPALGIWC